MSKCVIHNQQITHFCEKCCDIVCGTCLKNSHSDKLHQILEIQKAYAMRVTSIQSYLDSSVKIKRNSLLEQISKTTSKIEDIKKTSNIIKNDVHVEVEGLTLRLNNAQAEKSVKFQSEIKRLEHMVNIIDDVFYAFEESVKVPEKFLLLYKQFKQRIMNVDIYAIADILNDNHTILPEQFKKTEQQIEKSAELQRESKFINQVLKAVLQNYKTNLKQKQLEIRERQSKIIEQFFSMNQKLIAHNFSLSKCCYFCGQTLSISTINTTCLQNRPQKFGESRSSLFLQAPSEIKGTKRHHWISDRKQLGQNKHIQNNKIHLILIIMRKNLYQRGISINDIFRYEDKVSEGKVNKLVFSYVLSNRLGISQQQIELLMTNFMDSSGNVSYQRLDQLLKDKQYLQEPVSATSQAKSQEPSIYTKKYAY